MISSKTIKRIFFALAGLGFLSLSSCAYDQVMQERRAENQYLQGVYDAERARTEELKAQTPR